MKSKLTFDDSRWPLLIVTIEGVLTDEAFKREFLSNYDRYLRRGVPYSIVFDAREAGRSPPSQQRLMGDWMKKNASLMRQRIQGISFVIDNILVRMVFKSILFISPIPVSYIITKSFNQAVLWSQQKIQDAQGASA